MRVAPVERTARVSAEDEGITGEAAEGVWRLAKAREGFAELVDGALAGTSQVVRRRDRAEVVVSRDYLEKTRPSLKARLLTGGYVSDEDDVFDRAMREIREGSPLPFAPRPMDLQD